MRLDKKSMLLYAVTDRMWLNENSLETQVEDAIKAGVTFVQLREKDMSFDEFVAEAKKIKAICAKYNVPFVINDNVEVALAVDADGVHVGQSDMEAGDVRKRLGDNKIIGVSAGNVEQAITAQKHGADYLGVGAVFSTSTKLDARSVSHEMLVEITNSVNIPVIAIGGINKDNICELKGSGIDGIAVVSAIFAQKDISQATKELRNICEQTFC